MAANIRSNVLRTLMKKNEPVVIFLMNGFQMRGTIKSFDESCIVVHSDGKDNMIYPHAISTISTQSYVDFGTVTA